MFVQIPNADLYNQDCFLALDEIPPGSVDLVIFDPPYGITKNSWDTPLDYMKLWPLLYKVSKFNAAFIITSKQPHTTDLINSNREDFKYCLTWDKVGTTGFALAKKQPLRRHEDIVVFYRKPPIYNPIMEVRGKARWKGGSQADNGCYGDLRSTLSFNNEYYPTSIIQISAAGKSGKNHPTEKPIDLMSYLISTYSNKQDLVLDITMGSGPTGVAATNLERRFIGIEKDATYFKVAYRRIANRANYDLRYDEVEGLYGYIKHDQVDIMKKMGWVVASTMEDTTHGQHAVTMKYAS